MKPTIGRIVHYRLTRQDAEAVEARRGGWMPAAAGNPVKEGDTFPAMIVRTWGEQPTSAVQLQVFLDGDDVHWAQSVQVGDRPGTFSWPGAPTAPIGVAYGDRI